MTKEKAIELNPISIGVAEITIVGDGDLVLNKMNDPTARMLMDQRKNKAKKIEKANEWEEIITSMHWRDGKPSDMTEEGLKDALINNAPCITAFGLKKAFCNAVTRNEIDKNCKKFEACVNIIAKGGLVPIEFTEHYIDEKLMSPKLGKPVLVHLNRFSGWSAKLTISYIEGGAYSLEQIINVINCSGFGIGIGSGRSSGYGRYHVKSIE